MEREKKKQLEQVEEDEYRDEIIFQHSRRLSDLDNLMKKAGDAGQKRQVPDYMMSKVGEGN
jgi:Holliday junction resolvase RusA-like endonuclease